eukprot:8595936-Pyramimonas_sp.AAC.1
MHHVDANYVYGAGGGKGGKKALDIDHLLLRGSVLKNVDFVLGMVVYTGEETKLMQSAEPARRKVGGVTLK